MAIETERRFLVDPAKLPRLELSQATIKYVKQFYLSTDPLRTVRVRIAKEQSGLEKAYVTIKGKGNGISRPEFEYEIPVADALEMFWLRTGHVVEKTRATFPATLGGIQSSLYWELDVFSGDNSGLCIAEIELPTEDVEFDMPDWISCELLPDDWRYAIYTNSTLASVPMCTREYKDALACPGK